MPATPAAAKGLLLASIRDPNPVVFLEPKWLYRSAVEDVPEGDYTCELGKAHRWRDGTDITLVGWGAQMHVLAAAADAAAALGISCDLIELRTLLPWDEDAIADSVTRTGRLLVSHEAPRNAGYAAEICAAIQERCFLRLEAPVARVTGYDTPFPLVFEKLYVPDQHKILDAIKATVGF
jgi:2-oxoisovalerate dehydrogenase E1 component beta subunit